MKRVVLALGSTITVLVLLLSVKTPRPPGSAAIYPGLAAGREDDAIVTRAEKPKGKRAIPVGELIKRTPGKRSAQDVRETVVTVGDAYAFRWGTIQVQVSMRDDKIVDVVPVAMPSRLRRNVEIAEHAVPILREAVLAAQSTDVDTVSGATFTSEGYLRSLQSAINRAWAAMEVRAEEKAEENAEEAAESGNDDETVLAEGAKNGKSKGKGAAVVDPEDGAAGGGEETALDGEPAGSALAPTATPSPTSAPAKGEPTKAATPKPQPTATSTPVPSSKSKPAR